MKRLVIVANRVPDPKDRGATAGGLPLVAACVLGGVSLAEEASG